MIAARMRTLLLVLLACTSQCTATQTYRGVVSVTSADSIDMMLYTSDRGVFVLRPPHSNRHAFTSGDELVVETDSPCCLQNGLLVADRVRKDIAQSRPPQTSPVTSITATVYILSYCDYPPRSSRLVNVTMKNVARAFAICSNDIARFALPDIVPLRVPCAGTYGSNISFDLSTNCGTAERYAMLHHAPPSSGKHTILILPSDSPCEWAGIGNVGCTSLSCTVWINSIAPNTIMHELGHNMMLAHSGMGTDEYADLSCAMGYCCDLRCYNAPNNHVLGWSAPIADLTTLGAQRRVAFSIPAGFLRKHRDHVRFNDVYVSYKSSRGIESELGAGLHRNVLVHRRAQGTYVATWLLRQLAAVNDTWYVDGYVITLLNATNYWARVAFENI